MGYTMPPKPPRPPSFLDRYKQAQEQIGNPTQGREASYAVGNRVYNGVSNSPHSGGGLDPTGYQERDQRARQMKTSSLQKYITNLRK
jgi:hypothetical protein